MWIILKNTVDLKDHGPIQLEALPTVYVDEAEARQEAAERNVALHGSGDPVVYTVNEVLT